MSKVFQQNKRHHFLRAKYTGGTSILIRESERKRKVLEARYLANPTPAPVSEAG
jgi:hypothetical protein